MGCCRCGEAQLYVEKWGTVEFLVGVFVVRIDEELLQEGKEHGEVPAERCMWQVV